MTSTTTTMTTVRSFAAGLGVAVAVAGAALATAPAAGAATTDDCGMFPPGLHATTEVATYRGGALDLPSNNEANGQRVGTWTPNGSAAQTWAVWTYCDGTSAISHGDAGKVLDVDRASGVPQLWDTPGGWTGLNDPYGNWTPANQKWRLTDGGNGWRMAKNVATGQCLKSNGVGYLNSTAPCDPNDAGQWWKLG
ncbi:RICIN domain-containing protein [Streptomyces sp. NPDC042898]|uniref:RICIN domain-containing protein n=1 Tax=unclassified Streptomyces TaxID=2593676 RepID=UPI0033279B10